MATAGSVFEPNGTTTAVFVAVAVGVAVSVAVGVVDAVAVSVIKRMPLAAAAVATDVSTIEPNGITTAVLVAVPVIVAKRTPC